MKPDRYRQHSIVKAALIVTLVMLCALAVYEYGPDRSSLTLAAYFFLIFPGTMPFYLLIVVKGDASWPGYFVLGGILNWLMYVSLLTYIFGRRRRKVVEKT
jgi:hypothetical protein